MPNEIMNTVIAILLLLPAFANAHRRKLYLNAFPYINLYPDFLFWHSVNCLYAEKYFLISIITNLVREANFVTTFYPIMVGTFYRYKVLLVAIEIIVSECLVNSINCLQVSNFHMQHQKVWFQDVDFCEKYI